MMVISLKNLNAGPTSYRGDCCCCFRFVPDPSISCPCLLSSCEFSFPWFEIYIRKSTIAYLKAFGIWDSEKGKTTITVFYLSQLCFGYLCSRTVFAKKIALFGNFSIIHLTLGSTICISLGGQHRCTRGDA